MGEIRQSCFRDSKKLSRLRQKNPPGDYKGEQFTHTHVLLVMQVGVSTPQHAAQYWVVQGHPIFPSKVAEHHKIARSTLKGYVDIALDWLSESRRRRLSKGVLDAFCLSPMVCQGDDNPANTKSWSHSWQELASAYLNLLPRAVNGQLHAIQGYFVAELEGPESPLGVVTTIWTIWHSRPNIQS